jgi:hypothetical protein
MSDHVRTFAMLDLAAVFAATRPELTASATMPAPLPASQLTGSPDLREFVFCEGNTGIAVDQKPVNRVAEASAHLARRRAFGGVGHVDSCVKSGQAAPALLPITPEGPLSPHGGGAR